MNTDFEMVSDEGRKSVKARVAVFTEGVLCYILPSLGESVFLQNPEIALSQCDVFLLGKAD